MSTTVVNFRSRDGLGLNGTVESPTSSPPSGSALLIHGIHSEQHESGFYTDLARQLADAGVVSLRFDWRSQGDNSLPMSDLTLFGIVNDIHAGWRYLSQAHETTADGGLAVVAASFGGGPGIVWAHENAISARVRRAILLAPVVDYAFDLFRNEGISDDGFVDRFGADELADRGYLTKGTSGSLKLGRALVNELPFFNTASALANAQFPISILHGERDTDVPLSISRQHAKRHDHVDLEVIPGVDHGFVVPGTQFTDPANDATHDKVIARTRDLVLSALRV